MSCTAISWRCSNWCSATREPLAGNAIKLPVVVGQGLVLRNRIGAAQEWAEARRDELWEGNYTYVLQALARQLNRDLQKGRRNERSSTPVATDTICVVPSLEVKASDCEWHDRDRLETGDWGVVRAREQGVPRGSSGAGS